MQIETIVFFEIALSGFATVWIYRYFTYSTPPKYGEFEWLASCCIWGLTNIFIFELIFQKYPDLEKMLANPFATASVVSFFGVLFGYVGSRIVRFRLWKALINFLGKGGEQDKSGRFLN